MSQLPTTFCLIKDFFGALLSKKKSLFDDDIFCLADFLEVFFIDLSGNWIIEEKKEHQGYHENNDLIQKKALTKLQLSSSFIPNNMVISLILDSFNIYSSKPS